MNDSKSVGDRADGDKERCGWSAPGRTGRATSTERGQGDRGEEESVDSPPATAETVLAESALFLPLPHLPAELHDHILSFTGAPTLAFACLVSSTFLSLSRPHLYNSFWDLRLEADQIYEEWVAWEYGSHSLVETLSSNLHLAKLVRRLSIKTTFMSGEAETRRWRIARGESAEYLLDGLDERDRFNADPARPLAGSQVEDALVPFLPLLPSLTSLGIHCYTPIDIAAIWNCIKELPRLQDVKLVDHTYHGVRASFDRPLPDLPPLPSFASLQSLSISVKHDKGQSMDELREWCRGKNVELELAVYGLDGV